MRPSFEIIVFSTARASQKYARRPHEVKMLHEINKNLTKLTEKTLTKSGHGDTEDQATNVGRKSNKENEKHKSVKNQVKSNKECQLLGFVC